MPAGRPTDFTKELSLEIRKLILEGMSYVDIQKTLEIPAGTWDVWYYENRLMNDKSQGFRDLVNNTKQERIIKKAEANLEVLLDSEDERVRGDMTKFSLETIGKDKGYTKRTEQTGKNGAPLTVQVVNYGDSDNTA